MKNMSHLYNIQTRFVWQYSGRPGDYCPVTSSQGLCASITPPLVSTDWPVCWMFFPRLWKSDQTVHPSLLGRQRRGGNGRRRETSTLPRAVCHYYSPVSFYHHPPPSNPSYTGTPGNRCNSNAHPARLRISQVKLHTYTHTHIHIQCFLFTAGQ